MGILSKLTGKKEPRNQGLQPDAAAEAICMHGTLIPRWDRAEDMGHEDRAVSYTCESCGQSLSPPEAREVRAAASRRLRV